MRVCAEPGCGELSNNPRCQTHTRQRDQARGTRQQRGYDASHTKQRATYQQAMDTDRQYACWRCGDPINPNDWCLGHCDTNRNQHHGPECPACNYATAGRAGIPCPHTSHK